VCVRDPLVPVTVTVYEPDEPVHKSVLVPVLPNVTLVGERVQVRPVTGEIAAFIVTIPVNPWIFVTNAVEVPADPAFTVTLVGLLVTEKS
jgi:hypothetical protein